MGMIGAAVGAAGSIFGGISATMAMNKMKANVEAQKRENQDWYDRRYNEDSTQRADAQKILTMTQESIKKNNKAAAASQAVMGGTDESTAAAKEANNKALAEATSTIAVNGDKRKDAIEGQYRERDAALNQELNQIEKDKAAAIGQAVQGVSSAASSLPF
ncbi:hypothetical protein ABVC71_06105 [Prevotella amnii]|jgi:hypothetical protein|uniref:Uncharacterized protein n=1 Tax=Prevotella amnii DNF00058 TaxID=1401066 RepID=A0A096B059_9BACT|nr:hypothetical protein [Prevotella amnii]KGF52688.1 hypothetical protein HMPREF9302_02870 [Prevotella amnii DNF00058]